VKIVIFGRGKVGSSLARALRAGGANVSLRSGRAPLRGALEADAALILAVPDAHIAPLARRIAPRVAARQVVLHCAGARGPEELSACAERGAAVAGFHPLVSFPSRRRLPSLRDALFVAHGAPSAVRVARRVCRLIGAQCSVQPVLGPAYHAAAALLANGSAALAFGATRILLELGMSRREAERGAASLLGSVAQNVRSVGVPAALSGPVSRGDAATVSLHLRALAALPPPCAESYAAMLPVILACARAQGLDPVRARRIARLLPESGRSG
jgi:predicted short-subunit dehydrogenase-like oxidoreductase (DUF2520 family)